MKIVATLNSLIAALLMTSLLAACTGRRAGTNAPKAEGLQAEDVIGRWEAREIEIGIVSKANGNRDSSYILDASKQAAKMGRKPVLTIIQEDGEYREETRTMQDSLVREASGYWHLFSDSLVFRLKGVSAAEIRYHAARKGNRLQLRSLGDFDGDGKKDDRWTVLLDKQ